MRVGNTANLLLILALLVILARLIEPFFVNALHDVEPVQSNGILILDNFWRLPALEQRVVGILFLAPRLIFIWVAAQVVRLCLEFRGGEVFTLKAVTIFQSAAHGVIWLAVTKTLQYPLTSGFLCWRGFIPEETTPDYTQLFEIIEIDILMMGVFFFLIARILKLGLEMKAEQELTI